MGLTDSGEEAFDFSAYMQDPSNRVTIDETRHENPDDRITSGVSNDSAAEGIAAARPRDPETGQFVAEEGEEEEVEELEEEEGEEVEEEGEEEEPEAETEEEIQANLLAGKYKTPEDLEAAYENLQSLTGKQGQELADLRRQMADIQGQLQGGGVQQLSPTDRQAILANADDNPQGAALTAIENGDWELYNAVIATWKEYDPFSAADFNTDVKITLANQQQAAQLAAANQKTPEQEAAEYKAMIDTATHQFSREYPDLVPFLSFVDESSDDPDVQEILGNLAAATTPAQIVKYTRQLAKNAKASKADTIASESSKSAVARATKATAKKKAATVASGGKTSENESTRKQQVEQHALTVLGGPIPGSIAAGISIAKK